MAENKIEILIKAKDEASAALDKVSDRTQNMSKQFKLAGAAVTAAGVAIVAALGMCVKAAAEEEKGMVRLRVAAENVGIAYGEVEESLERWIDTMQQKTAVADSEQRDSLASLLRITRDVEEAQDLLTLAMDVAIGTGRDLASATTLLMYALSGNWGMLERYIPAIKEAADEEEKWMMLRELFAGQAEEYGKTLDAQMKLLSHNIGDIKEAIGTALMPTVLKIVSAFADFAQALKEMNPTIIKAGTVIAALTGVLALIAGPALLFIGFLPSMTAGLVALTGSARAATIAVTALRFALSTLIPVVAAVVAGLTIGYFIYKQWGDAIDSVLYPIFRFIGLTESSTAEITKHTEAIIMEKTAMMDANATMEERTQYLLWQSAAAQVVEGNLEALAIAMDVEKVIAGEAGEVTRAYAEALLESGAAADTAAEQLGDYIAAFAVAQIAEEMTEDALKAYIEAVKEFGPRSEEARAVLLDYVGAVAQAKDAQLDVEEALRGLDERIDVVDETVEKSTDIVKSYADAWANARREMERLKAEGGAFPGGGVPGFQYGGVVPGPIGAPRLVMAHGGEQFLGAGAGGAYNDNTHLEFHVLAVIREEADIDRIAWQLYELQRQHGLFKGIKAF